jgi:serine phosphatase RsbU (regulator of sigma subunit)
MLLYTDSIAKALGTEGNMFSKEKLHDHFHQIGNQSPQKIKHGILNALAGFTPLPMISRYW